MFRNTITALAFLFTATLASVSSAEISTFESLIDSQGYPLDDPLYEEIRGWVEQEHRGLNLFRSKEYETAYPLLAGVAKHGFKRAQHSLAVMHANGYGVDKNVLVGVALLGLAAESGDPKLEREYKKGLKAIPEKYRELVGEQVKFYVARYGMETQGISCERIERTGSNLKQLLCLKRPGDYQTFDWAP